MNIKLYIHYIYYKGHHRRLHLRRTHKALHGKYYYSGGGKSGRKIGVGLHRKLLAKFPLHELDDARSVQLAARVCNRLSGYSGYSDIRKNLSVRIVI